MNKVLRAILFIFILFNAITATAGGIAILTGLDKFPSEWLETTPFSSYTIPAIILSCIVGGSAWLAVFSFKFLKEKTYWFSIISGIMMCAYVGTEAIILNQIPHGPTGIEIFYFLLGLLIILISLYLNKIKFRL